MEHKKVIEYKNVHPQEEIFGWNDVKHFHLGQYILMHSVIYRTDFLKLCQLPFLFQILCIFGTNQKNHYRTYWKIRYGILGQTMNLPGRSGRKISSLAYIVARRIVGFN